MLAPYKAKTEKPTPRPAEITDAIGFITASDPVFAAKVEQILSQDSPFKNSAEALLQVYGKKIMEKDYQDSEGFKNLKNNVIKSLNEMDFQIQQEAQARYAEYQQNNIPFTGYDIYGTAKSGMAAANPNTMKIVEDRNRILREAAEMQKNMTLKAAPNLNFNMNTNKSKAGDRRGL
jgi:DNA-binding MltR family transcriptional regulator